jgi:hypothetical protein
MWMTSNVYVYSSICIDIFLYAYINVASICLCLHSYMYIHIYTVHCTYTRISFINNVLASKAAEPADHIYKYIHIYMYTYNISICINVYTYINICDINQNTDHD